MTAVPPPLRAGCRASCTLLLAATLLAGAAEAQLIKDPGRRAAVAERFALQKALARDRAARLFGVFDHASPEEREALEYLFAYMPLEDLADYDGEYFLRVVRATLEARRAMPWAGSIPEDVFLAYVLPYRVNTEDLDDARTVLFAELRDRVKELPLRKAVLEVNHWCHEKVTYRPSDARTSAPLATLRTSWGRCGEESTLTVSALRAVGIPARQVYTPRWAHTDDNHAWVEAWVDGSWRYLGACEPEPQLDMGWFSEPSRRAMMVHTKVFGGSRSGEDKVRSTPYYDEIQVLGRYAEAVERTVTVEDQHGNAIAGAEVEFGLYNYAEFYPLASVATDRDGRARLTSGRGDLRLWVRAGERFASALLTADETHRSVRVAPLATTERVEELDLAPPPEPWPRACPASRQERERNRARLMAEDAARGAHMAGFLNNAAAAAVARELGHDDAAPLLGLSAGNHAELAAFLRATPPARRRWATALLKTLSEKDLRDTPATVLLDHLEHALTAASELATRDPALFTAAVLAPRIDRELLSPWRRGIEAALGGEILKQAQQDPGSLAYWLRRRLRIDTAANWYGVPMRPLGTLQLGVADPLARDILFVAICRTAGVPARLDPATRAPQFFADSWKTVSWTGSPDRPTRNAQLTFTARLEDRPAYSTHFALARFASGRYETLDYQERPWEFFAEGFAVEAGHYCLTTGRREYDGSVRVRQHYFAVEPGASRSIPVVLRAPARPPVALGKFEMDVRLPSLANGRTLELAQLSRGKGIVIAWIGSGDEPSAHAMADLVRLRSVFERWDGTLILALQRREATLDALRDLAPGTEVAFDGEGRMLAKLLAAAGRTDEESLPVLAVVSAKGDVVFASSGYRVGVGEQLLRAIRRLNGS